MAVQSSGALDELVRASARLARERRLNGLVSVLVEQAVKRHFDVVVDERRLIKDMFARYLSLQADPERRVRKYTRWALERLKAKAL